MTKLTITKPEIGKPDATEDVKLVNALTAIEAWANGLVSNGEGISEGELIKAVQEKLLGNGRVTEAFLTAALQTKINAKVEIGSAYALHEKVALSTEFEPSATFPTFVVLTFESSANYEVAVRVGGVYVGAVQDQTGTIGQRTISFICPAGKKWIGEKVAGTPIVQASYLQI